MTADKDLSGLRVGNADSLEVEVFNRVVAVGNRGIDASHCLGVENL